MHQSKTIKLFILSCILFTIFVSGQCPIGNVVLNSQEGVDDFVLTYPNCETILGDLFITGDVNDLSALNYLRSIDGNLIIQDTQLTTISNFENLNLISNNLVVIVNQSLIGIEGFNSITSIGGDFILVNNPNLFVLNGFNNLLNILDNFQVNSNKLLETIDGFENLETIDGFLEFNDCPFLVTVPNFNKLKAINSFIAFNNTGLISISGFDNLSSIDGTNSTSGLKITNNNMLDEIAGFFCLKTIAYDIVIHDNYLLESIKGLNSLERVGHFFSIINNNELSELYGFQSLAYVASSAYESSVVFTMQNNSQLSNCSSLCSLLASDGIVGLTLLSDNLTGCNSKDQINASNCMPFEILSCTNLSVPIHGEIDVDIDTNISWNPIPGATSYIISIGTTSEGTQIVNNLDVGNTTSYSLTTNFPENTEIFVKVKPYNRWGPAQCCSEESFVTKTINLFCPQLSMPLNNETNVSTSTRIAWNEVPDATGYMVSLGTSSGATNLANQIDVGKETSFLPPENLPNNTTIFVTITPYAYSLTPLNCFEERFVTQAEPIDCSNLLNPINGAINIPVSTTISWSMSSIASSYILNIGTTLSGSEIVNNINIGNTTEYLFSENLPYGTIIYVTITPFNDLGQAQECITESFTTESLFIPKFFTPNNDGYNDTWLVKDPLNQIEVVYIYNRYGKLLKSIGNSQNGWNGNVNNKTMPASEYWYVIKLKSGNQLNGHFTLKH